MNLSQAGMARRLKVSVASYQRYERGEKDTPSDALRILAEEGFDVEWILTGKSRTTGMEKELADIIKEAARLPESKYEMVRDLMMDVVRRAVQEESKRGERT